MSRNVYQDPIVDLARRACGHGHLHAPRGSVTLDNLLCGDRIEMDVNWGDHGGVSALGHVVRGCLLCRAAASLLGETAPGRSADDIALAAQALESMLSDSDRPPPAAFPELSVFTPVCGHTSRFECVLLPFRALLKALTKGGT